MDCVAFEGWYRTMAFSKHTDLVLASLLYVIYIISYLLTYYYPKSFVCTHAIMLQSTYIYSIVQ